jgi:hypothetical protein
MTKLAKALQMTPQGYKVLGRLDLYIDGVKVVSFNGKAAAIHIHSADYNATLDENTLKLETRKDNQ